MEREGKEANRLTFAHFSKKLFQTANVAQPITNHQPPTTTTTTTLTASAERRRRVSAAEHGACHDEMAEAIEASCGFRFSDYAFKYADLLYTTCERTGGDAAKAVAAVENVCA